ncbi:MULTISPECIES: 2OG-Fe(II) oxygenase [Sphingomonas]|uniref:2OG-Fe(II) oxygenase n=1 Tax=Sphingomonas TaxID=13687 RepID=UPI000837786A|nr:MULTISPECIES: 2OG-Fe(II) oxygenase [Sphingomonas]
MTPSRSAAERARSLAETGDATAAAAVLEHAGAAGDADALMQLAVWRLVGTPLPRDLTVARALLARAAAIGHVDAALMQVALTANGSGAAAPDWRGALALLRVAAAGDPVAAAQLALVDAMTIDAAGRPVRAPVGELLCDAPRVVRFRGFLSAAECAHVAGVAAPMLAPARVIDPASGRWVTHPVRTADDAAIGPANEDMVVRAINARIAAASGTDIAAGEPLTVLRYRPGQQYRPHLDTMAGAANQRVMTMLLYLNAGYRGGDTHFPAPGLSVVPVPGDALLFRNTLPDGRPDPLSRHAGQPVLAGTKWLATRWIRAAPIDPWALSG